MWFLSREQWSVGLSDRHLALVSTDLWSGNSRAIQAARLEPGDTGSAWEPAVDQLEAWLKGPSRPGMLNITLSDRLTRWQLMAWPVGTRRPRELQEYARAHFEQVYGKVAGDWSIQLGAHAAGGPVAACAVDAELLAALRRTCERTGTRLRAVRPYFGRVIDHWQQSLRERRFWLAVVEQGHLCLGLAQDGRWLALDGQRCGPQWQSALAGLRQRIAAFETPHAADDRLYVAGTVATAAALEGQPWQLLQPGPSAAGLSADDRLALGR